MTTYPMVIALELLKEIRESINDISQVIRIDEWIKKLEENIQEGYNLLMTYETSTKGYEWFGTSPGHEALSAYGLNEFRDMNRVVEFVSPDGLIRNKDWLLSRRKSDGSGQFDKNPKALDTFGHSDQDITDAYIVWSLTFEEDIDYTFLKAEFENLERISLTSKDPYFLALYSAALFNVDKLDEAILITNKVNSMQNEETGAVEGASSSITNSRGQNLIVETTALCMMNWINQDKSSYFKQIELSLKFI